MALHAQPLMEEVIKVIAAAGAARTTQAFPWEKKPALNPWFSSVLHYVFLKGGLLVFAKSGFTLCYKLSSLNILLPHASTEAYSWTFQNLLQHK